MFRYGMLIASFVLGGAFTFLLRTPSAETGQSSTFDVPRWIALRADIPRPTRAQLLMGRLAAFPGEATRCLEAIDALWAEENRSVADTFAGDVALFRAVQGSIALITDETEASMAATARTVLQRRAEQSVGKLLQELGASINIVVKTGELDFESLDAIGDTLDLLEDAAELSIPADVSSILKPGVDRILGDADKARTRIRSELSKAERESANGAVVEPVNSDQQGLCHQWLREIQRIQLLLAHDQIRRWYLLTSPPGQPMDDLDITVQQLQELEFDVVARQMRLYNLWALRKIRTAEEADSWPSLLGSINRELLHPSVMGMWSMVHDRRMAEVNDRADRPGRVRELLTAKQQVQLEHF